jgi:ABC-type Fe3+/spermidine/putrescine transport system ATPase subunit
VSHGSYRCLLGPSGCGKTPLLRLMAGHETPTTGDVRIGGESVLGLPPVRRGRAQEIYTRPHSAYVARFMGGHNVFSGRMAAAANGSARLMSSGGELYAIPMQPPSTAQETVVWFSVRRDQIELANASRGSAPATEPNAVCGTVQAINCQGSYVKVTVHRSGHEDVIAHVPDRGFFPMQVRLGDRVLARWSVDDVHILPAKVIQ